MNLEAAPLTPGEPGKRKSVYKEPGPTPRPGPGPPPAQLQPVKSVKDPSAFPLLLARTCVSRARNKGGAQ